MADERIDIEITDKVDANIEKKIIGIANASDKGFTAVQKLKSALKDVNTSAVTKLAAASNAATNALAREMSATAKLTIAKAREAETTGKLAVQAQRLATEQAKTAAATLKAQAAADKAAAAKQKEANASAKLTAELEREASAKTRIIHDANTVKPGSGANLGGSAGSRSDAAGATNQMRRSTIDVVPANLANDLKKVTEETDKTTNSLGKAAAGAGLARHQMVNLGYQLQDIIVSLQAGQNPLTVFIQQGSQIAGIAAASGVNLFVMAKAVWALIAPFTPLVALLAAAYFGFKNFTAEMNTSHSKELQDYANSLGLTSKEMRKLGNESVDANGKLKSFNTVTITMGDSWNGFTATVKEGLSSLLAPFAGVTGYFSSAWETAVGFVRTVFVGFYALVMTLIKSSFGLLGNIVRAVANAALLVANTIVGTIQEVLNVGISGMNLLIDGYNKVQSAMGFEKPVAALGKVDLGIRNVTDGMLGMIEVDPLKTLNEEARTADRTLKAIGKRWDENTLAATKARLAAQAAAIIGNRNPKAPKKPKEDHTAENRAHALDVLNSKLDDELSRMKLLKPERDIQQRMDQIENDLLQKKIKLNDAERASILAKVRAVEEYKFVQAESDRIYEEAIGPQRTMNASITAAADLYDRAAISAEQYGNEVRRATRAFDEATDPLFGLKESTDAAMRASTLYGRAVERNNVLEQARQAYAAKGIPLYDIETGKLDAKVAALLAQNDALVQQQYLQSQIGAIVNPLLEEQMMVDNKAAMYAEIDRLRQADVLSEEMAQRARLGLDAKFTELRLSGMSSAFGEMAKLQSSSSKELAAIGKAAAVAQATIDGYVAVQKALASAPPPWNFVAAAAVGLQTGAQVAGIMSTNVGNFANGGGFMVDGRAGVDNNNVNMNLSRGERVTVETPAQQRANDAGGDEGKPPLNVKVVNVTDPKDIEAALSNPDNDYLILNALRRNPAKAASLIGR